MEATYVVLVGVSVPAGTQISGSLRPQQEFRRHPPSGTLKLQLQSRKMVMYSTIRLAITDPPRLSNRDYLHVSRSRRRQGLYTMRTQPTHCQLQTPLQSAGTATVLVQRVHQLRSPAPHDSPAGRSLGADRKVHTTKQQSITGGMRSRGSVSQGRRSRKVCSPPLFRPRELKCCRLNEGGKIVPLFACRIRSAPTAEIAACVVSQLWLIEDLYDPAMR